MVLNAMLAASAGLGWAGLIALALRGMSRIFPGFEICGLFTLVGVRCLGLVDEIWGCVSVVDELLHVLDLVIYMILENFPSHTAIDSRELSIPSALL